MTDRPRFPEPAWAWPTGGLDLLLRAVLIADRDAAQAAARQWFATTDLDQAGFAEQRLLMAVCARFGHELGDLPEYPRLAGLQRMLWTKARMALREVQPPLAQMAAAGIPVMMLKGAARLAASPQDQKSRVSHDTDILVPPAYLATALSILTRHGWQASTGESALCLAQRLPMTRAINLFHGHFGDIDLHQWGYGDCPVRADLEEDLWQSARPAQFFGISVLIPSPEHRIALSLSSSALDAHAHSDWLVDCGQVLTQEAVEPQKLADLLARADLLAEADVALPYLAEHLRLPVPALSELRMRAKKLGWLHRAAVVLQMKPRSDWTPISRFGRGLAKQLRKLHQRRLAPAMAQGSRMWGRFGRRAGQPDALAQPLSAPVVIGSFPAGSYAAEISVAVQMPGQRRRIEFELNGAACHVARLRTRDLWGRHGWYRLRFSGRIVLETSDILSLEARPSKTLRGADAEEAARYATLPAHLLSASIRPLNQGS